MATEKTGQVHRSVIFFVLGGLLLILFSILWEDAAANHQRIETTGIHLLNHLGVGSLVIGVLGFAIDLEHWREYFRLRLKEIVIEKKYMQGMSPSALKELQTNLLAAYYNDDTIAGEHGFLQHYQNNIQDFIASPYRVNVESDLLVEYAPGTKDKICVHEQISWYCKRNRGDIQKEVKWMPEENEFDSVDNLVLRLQHDSFERNKDGVRELRFPYESFDPSVKRDHNGFVFPLTPYINCDNLKITITVDYIISTQKFYAWAMTLPSRGLTLTIRFPKDLKIVAELFGLEDNCDESNDVPGFYKLATTKWILPEQGMVFQFLPRPPAPQPQEAANGMGRHPDAATSN